MTKYHLYVQSIFLKFRDKKAKAASKLTLRATNHKAIFAPHLLEVRVGYLRFRAGAYLREMCVKVVGGGGGSVKRSKIIRLHIRVFPILSYKYRMKKVEA